MKAGRYDEAASGFQVYLAKYPRGPRADNATYWLGEAQYMQQDFEGALKSFQAVNSFPESRRLADAMLKVGVLPVRIEGLQERAHDPQQGDLHVSGFRRRHAGAGATREDERRGPVTRLKITETFVSIQGEADAAGWPTLFIRLTGCPLRCTYCDTTYSFYGGEWRTLDELLQARATAAYATSASPAANRWRRKTASCC